MKYLLPLLLLTGCFAAHQDSIDDVIEKVEKNDRGVIIDIEPGKKA